MSEDLYYLSVAGETQGPLTFGQLKTMWANGRIVADAHYFTEGMSEWEPILNLASQLDAGSETKESPSHQPKKTTVAPRKQTGKEQVVCPICGQNDMIQKVSTVHSQGVSQSVHAGGGVGVAIDLESGDLSPVFGAGGVVGKSQTALSARLTPPEQPSTPYSEEGNTFAGIILIGIGAMLFFVAIGIFIAMKGRPDDMLMTIIALSGIAGVGLIGMAWYNMASLKRLLKEQDEALRLWQATMSVWNRLYYCSRDDCVFDSEKGRSAPAENWRQLIR